MKSLLSFQFRDFCSRVVELFNVLTKTYGEKLTCSQLNRELDNVFNQQYDWTAETSFEYGGTRQTGYRSKQLNDITCLVCAPAHDLLDESSNAAQRSGGRSAASVLEEIKNNFPTGQIRTLIPIAQSNPLGCFGPRGHFALCEVDINDGKISTITLHDSKAGLVDAFYHGAEHLKEQFLAKENLGLDKQFILNTQHHGHQHLLNGNDCGRYTIYYANIIAEAGSLTDASVKAAREFFSPRSIR
ncbi:MAG: hypothetical protein ACMZI0_10145 [Symbiopectobacterium sp.]|uniref:hypothetical protein n=1 Tax=Symbiopectobacterium sp. TaxID=2952789 RepID=UPI0039E9C466